MRRPTLAAVHRLVSEEQFELWVMSVARLGGWHGVHTRKSFGVMMGVFKGDAFGIPDWIFSNGVRTIWRELKTERGRETPYQRVWIERLVESGQDAKVWRPSDEAEILATFRR